MNNLYLVYSRPPEGVTSAEYDQWYAAHAQENIESKGFVSAQRYEVREVKGADEVGPEHHLALYEYAGDMSIWRQDLSARIEAKEIVLPDFFPGIEFKSWRGHPVGGRLTPKTH
jgi:hypothetical protein